MIRLDNRDADFGDRFAGLVAARRAADSNISRDVAAIIADVRARGDSAVSELTRRFDGHDLGWRIAAADSQTAVSSKLRPVVVPEDFC